MPAGETSDLRVKLVRQPGSDDLPPPVYATAGAAGADLHAALDAPLSLAPGERALVPTGLSLALPRGYEGQVRPRSGRAVREGLTLLNTPGTIDSDYRGEVKVLVINQGREEVTLRRGDRIAQLVIAPVVQAVFEAVSHLPETARDAGGFGHTGN